MFACAPFLLELVHIADAVASCEDVTQLTVSFIPAGKRVLTDIEIPLSEVKGGPLDPDTQMLITFMKAAMEEILEKKSVKIITFVRETVGPLHASVTRLYGEISWEKLEDLLKEPETNEENIFAFVEESACRTLYKDYRLMKQKMTPLASKEVQALGWIPDH